MYQTVFPIEVFGSPASTVAVERFVVVSPVEMAWLFAKLSFAGAAVAMAAVAAKRVDINRYNFFM